MGSKRSLRNARELANDSYLRSLRSARELANERVTKGHRHNQTKTARAPFETPGSSLTGLLRERYPKDISLTGLLRERCRR